MDLSDKLLQEIALKIQDVLFKKGNKEEAIMCLKNSNITLENLISNFYISDDYKTIDLIINIMNLLLNFNGFKEELIQYITEKSKEKSDVIFSIKSTLAKKYFIGLLGESLGLVYKEKFLPQLFKIYFINENTGIYTETLKVFIKFIQSKFIEKETIISLMENVLCYLNQMITNKDSILYLRKLEIILCYIDFTFEDNQFYIKDVYDSFKEILGNFYLLDTLSQLSVLETLENDINNVHILSLLNANSIFFNEKIMELDQQVMRKLLYTFSKFYARNLLSEDVKLIKNTLVISMQYYDDNKSVEFICPVFCNIFTNKTIYRFLSEEENNIQYNFISNIIRIFTEIFINPDPSKQIMFFEVLEYIFDFENDLNLGKDIYDKHMKFVNSFISDIISVNSPNETDPTSKFIEILISEFKKKDLPDYELAFLKLIYKILSDLTLTKKLLSNLDMILYLTEKRDKPKDICDLKYKINQKIVSNNVIINQLNNEFAMIFREYVTKGPYIKEGDIGIK